MAKIGGISKVLHAGKSMLIKNAPSIGIACGLLFMLDGTIEACKLTPKYITLTDEKRLQKTRLKEGINATEPTEELTPWESVCVGAEVYWKPIIYELCGITFIILAHNADIKRLGGAIAACKLSEKELNEYKDATIKTVGENKERLIRDSIIKNEINENPPNDNEVILIEGGNTLFYDENSGRYFRSSMAKIESAVNAINRKLIVNYDIRLNDFYDEIGLPPIEIGDNLGWTIENTMDDIALTTTGHKMNDGQIITGISFNIGPWYIDYGEQL